MEVKEIQYFFVGLSNTVAELYDQVYDTLVVKGKKRMGQETKKETPQISELIKRTREEQTISELLSKGKKGQEELIKSIGSEVKKILSSAGIVTRTDLARLEKRMNEIEKTLGEKSD
jgi:polyhydroxyalkanoate synthesis regulator phasin